MARNRMIKPEFWEDAKIAKLSDKAKLLFIAMWNFADDEGYLPYDNDWIRVKSFPYEPQVEVKPYVEELLKLERIVVKNGVIQILKFLEHQKINRPQKSKLKIVFSENSVSIHGAFNDHSVSVHSQKKLKEVKRKEEKEKLRERKGSVKERETEVGGNPQAPDFSLLGYPERQNERTANDRTTARDEGSLAAGTTTPASCEIISSTSVDTFKARVEYAKSLGIEERVAMRICNFAQSKKYPLAEMHYKSFVGKGEQEVEESFSVLKLVAQTSKKAKGLKRINSS